jgi:hypothetical protein
MFIALPPTSKNHWVYDDPSGVAEPTPYPRPWRRRATKRAPQVTALPNRVVRVTHVEN